MTHGSLFSGIGGFDLAAQWMGWDNLFHCEINPFGQRVLKYYWPHAELFTDITKTDFTKYANTIDVLTGGFPCQPYSAAGKRLGTEDERHLWPEMLRAIREISPRWIVGENVRGLTNWNRGLVFDEVQANLEAEGYEITPFLLPACALNAPHRRDRIWFIAHTPNKRHSNRPAGGGEKRQAFTGEQSTNDAFWRQPFGLGGNATYPDGLRLERPAKPGFNINSGRAPKEWQLQNWAPIAARLCDGTNGVPERLDGNAISFGKWRIESVKAAGNAIVPQVVYQIFQTIHQYETAHNS